MLKQKKEIKLTLKEIKKRLKAVKRLKSLFKYSIYYINPIFRKYLEIKHSNKLKYQLSIRITSNNTFCSLKDLKKKRLLLVSSAGKYKINITKRKLNFSSKIVIENFLEETQKYLKTQLTIINISGPKKLRKKIIRQINLKFKKIKFIIKVNELKCFNGCRPKKKKTQKTKRPKNL